MNTSAKRSPDLTPLSPQQELIDREQKPTGGWVYDPRFPRGNLRRWVNTPSTDNMEQEVQECKHMKTLPPSTCYPPTMPSSPEGPIFAGIEAHQASSLFEPDIPITKTMSKAEPALMEPSPASDAGVEGKAPTAGESLTTYETVDLKDDESDWESIHTPSLCGSDRAPDSDVFEPFELIEYATERMVEEEDGILGYGITDSAGDLIARTNNTISDTYFTDASPQEKESRLQQKFENYTTATDGHFAAAWTEYFNRSEVSLENWQRLLRDLGVKGDLSSITMCKKALNPIWVDVSQFLKAERKPQDVIFYPSERALAAAMEKKGRLVRVKPESPCGALGALCAKLKRHFTRATAGAED